jgi:hypothetical protein
MGKMISHAMTTKRLPMNEAVASLNSDVHLTIAIDAVELTPDTMSVAPVSPRERANAKTDPEKIPERDNGNNILRNVVSGFAPNVREAVSKVVSIEINFVARVRTIYGKVRATWTIKTMNGTLRRGMTASRGINPEFNPRTPPIPETVVHVISVAKPKPEVGITRGSVTMSSKRFFPRNVFLARRYASGIPKSRSNATVVRDRRKEKKRTCWICLQFSSPIIGFANTS